MLSFLKRYKHIRVRVICRVSRPFSAPGALGLAQGPSGTAATLPSMGHKPATIRSQIQRPNPLSHTLLSQLIIHQDVISTCMVIHILGDRHAQPVVFSTLLQRLRSRLCKQLSPTAGTVLVKPVRMAAWFLARRLW